LQYYNIAAQDSVPGFENVQRLEFLLSPYARFINLNYRDSATNNILDEAAAGLHPAAAIAKTLGIEANTVHNFINANPPRTLRSHLSQRLIETHNTSRALVKSLDTIPLALWPRGELEWAAFFRVQEYLDVHEENLPVPVSDYMGKLANNTSLKTYHRWHGVEALVLSCFSRRLAQREQKKPIIRKGEKIGYTLNGSYWTTKFDNDGNMIDHDIRMNAMYRIIDPAYEKLWQLYQTPVSCAAQIEAINLDDYQDPEERKDMIAYIKRLEKTAAVTRTQARNHFASLIASPTIMPQASTR